MAELRRITIFADDPDDERSEDFLWVEAWLKRWENVVRIEDYSTGGWEHVWDLEGPQEAIEQVPHHLLCCSEWATPEIFGKQPDGTSPPAG